MNNQISWKKYYKIIFQIPNQINFSNDKPNVNLIILKHTFKTQNWKWTQKLKLNTETQTKRAINFWLANGHFDKNRPRVLRAHFY